MSEAFSRLVHELKRLPGVGEKSAGRLAYHLVGQPKRALHQLAEALVEVSERIGLCTVCMDLTESEVCKRCVDPTRDRSLICVVASPTDVAAIDRAAGFRGNFHVLHGVLAPLEGIGPEDLRIKELLARISAEEPPEEVILATSANVDGESTALYLAKLIKPHDVRVSRIASGLPVGGELEYTDQATISRALAGRRQL